MSIGVLKSICVDFSDESLYQYITVFSEEIYSRTIEITPLNNGEEYIIPAETTARLEARKPDNNPILLDSKIDFTNNKIYIELTPKCLDTPGVTSCQIGLYGVDNRFIASSYFYIDVYRSALSGNGSVNHPGCNSNVVESSPEYQSFRVALLSVDEVQKRANAAILKAENDISNAIQNMDVEIDDAVNKISESAEEAIENAKETNESVSKNELERKENETQRQQNEQLRDAAEEDRKKDFEAMVTDFGDLGGIAVSNEEPESERVVAWIDPSDDEKTLFMTSDDITQELGNDPNKVLSQKAATREVKAEEARAIERENEIEALFVLPTQEAVDKWLDEHPEATTTVQDGSLTESKFTDELKLHAIKDYVTPQMFGAKGDGVNDDTDAIARASEFLKSKGGTLLFPAGTYLIGTFNVDMNPKGVLGFSAIKCYSNIIYKGEENAVIKVADNINTETTAFQSVFTEFDYGLHDVTFDNIIFELNGKNNLFPKSLRNKAYMCAGIRTLYPKNITIKNCKFLHCAGLNCVSLGHAENAIVFNNHFLDNADVIENNTEIWDHSAFISHGKNIEVRGNIFYNTTNSKVASALELNTENGIVVGNTFVNHKIGVLISPISEISTKNTCVSNNYFYENYTSISLWSMDSADSGLDGVVIDGNTFENLHGSNATIDIYTHVREFCKNIIISNNNFKMVYSDSIYPQRCIYVGNGAENIQICNNIVDKYSGYFLYILNGCDNLNVEGNLVFNCSQSNHDSMPGVRPYIVFDGANTHVSNIMVKDNHFKDETGLFSSGVCLMFLADCRYITIENNIIQGFAAEIDNEQAIFDAVSNNYFRVKHQASVNRGSVAFRASLHSEFITPSGVKFVKQTNDLSTGHWNLLYYNSTAEVGSAYYCNKGSVIMNTEPQLNSSIGWVCTESGWGGTWKSFGVIS